MGFHLKSALRKPQIYLLWRTCRAFVHVDSSKRTKMEKRSVLCVLIGYTDNGYIFQELSTGKIINSRDATFHEAFTNSYPDFQDLALI